MARELVLIPRVKYESLIRQLENDKSIDSEFKECKKNINNDMQDMTDNVTNNVTSDHSSLKLINQSAPAHLEGITSKLHLTPSLVYPKALFSLFVHFLISISTSPLL